MEYLDVYNDKHEHIGVCEKKLVHKLGLWHDVFTCQIINPKKKTMFFQIKNHSHNDLHDKDLIEITVGGHYKSGEKIENGIREIKEETGLDVKYEQLFSLGIRQVSTTVNENYIIREFQHIFLLPLDISATDFKEFDKEEVKDIVEINIEELISLLLEKKEFIYGFVKNKQVKITLENFVKSYLENDKLYLRLVVAAKRYINNEDKELIFW